MSLEIPEFLRRKAHPTNEFIEENRKPYIKLAYVKRPLTIVLRERIALEVNTSVLSGANTFGKLRKKLDKKYTDKELRSGISFAKSNWINTSRKLLKLKNNNKIYFVETA